MIEILKVFLYKPRSLMAGTLICLLFLLLFLGSVLINPTAYAQEVDSTANTSDAATEDSPNIITRGMFRTVDKLSQAANSSGAAISNGLNSIGESTAAAAAKSGKFIANTTTSGVSLAGRAVGGSLTFAIHSTGSTISFIADLPGVSDVIRPSDKTIVTVATVGEVLAQSQTGSVNNGNVAQSLLPVATDSAGAWPIRGQITTGFGVPHWPYQPIHTGLDISDGQPSGVTPIHPFKAGKVREVVRSTIGLGNYVVIDHGGGIVSVYGHLAATSVQPGQQVNQANIVGYEGSTGVSTGTHLHFEIRLNGQPIDPGKYISGQP